MDGILSQVLRDTRLLLSSVVVARWIRCVKFHEFVARAWDAR